MGNIRSATEVVAVALGALLVACDGGTGPGGGGGGGGSITDPCDGVRPYESAACARHIADTCGALTDERGCADQRPWYADSSEPVRCAWAQITTFADVATCAIADQEMRCFGFFGGGPVEECLDVCPSSPTSDEERLRIAGAFRTINATAELVRRPCFEGELLDGPITEDIASLDTVEIGSCAPNTLPPPIPVCECIDATCDGGG